jgi:hypothetical protein
VGKRAWRRALLLEFFQAFHSLQALSHASSFSALVALTKHGRAGTCAEVPLTVR